MEIGAFEINFVPRKEVGVGQVVATFVEIGTHAFSFPTLYFVVEQGGGGYNLYHAPSCFALA